MDLVHLITTTKQVVTKFQHAPNNHYTVSDFAVIEEATPNIFQPPGKRKAHAKIEGAVRIVGEGNCDVAGLRRISYNARRSSVFRYTDDESEWKGSDLVLVTGGYAYEVVQ